MALFRRKAAKAKEEATEVAKNTAVEEPKKAAKATTKKAAKKGGLSPLATRTALSPLVTEKSARLADSGVYAFSVPVSANRVEVREAFRELYKVTPLQVNILRVHGKEKRFGRVISRASNWKKALVTVPKGTRIDVFTV